MSLRTSLQALCLIVIILVSYRTPPRVIKYIKYGYLKFNEGFQMFIIVVKNQKQYKKVKS